MTDRLQRTKRVDNDGGVTTQTTRTVDNDMEEPIAANEAPAASVAERIIWFIAGILLVLLAFRFVFILLGANRANGFADFIYTASHPFAAPFFGLFSYEQEFGVSRIELSTLVAMAVYALVAWGLSRLATIRRP
jgi:hypothetical protein